MTKITYTRKFRTKIDADKNILGVLPPQGRVWIQCPVKGFEFFQVLGAPGEKINWLRRLKKILKDEKKLSNISNS